MLSVKNIRVVIDAEGIFGLACQTLRQCQDQGDQLLGGGPPCPGPPGGLRRRPAADPPRSRTGPPRAGASKETAPKRRWRRSPSSSTVWRRAPKSSYSRSFLRSFRRLVTKARKLPFSGSYLSRSRSQKAPRASSASGWGKKGQQRFRHRKIQGHPGGGAVRIQAPPLKHQPLQLLPTAPARLRHSSSRLLTSLTGPGSAGWTPGDFPRPGPPAAARSRPAAPGPSRRIPRPSRQRDHRFGCGQRCRTQYRRWRRFS